MFWERFYSLCLERGVKPNQIREDIGLSSTGAITKWKKDGIIPSQARLKAIACYFGVSVDYLTGHTEDRHPPAPPGTKKTPAPEGEGEGYMDWSKMPELYDAARWLSLEDLQSLLRHAQALRAKQDILTSTSQGTKGGNSMFWNRFFFLCVESYKTPGRVVYDLGFPGSTIARFRQGEIPSKENLRKIADYFGESVSYLIGDSDERSPEGEGVAQDWVKNPRLGDYILQLSPEDIKTVAERVQELRAAQGILSSFEVDN